jgi:hypothetical protein
MQEIGAALATLTRDRNRRFSHLLRGCIEGGLHPGAGGRCLHPGEKSIEFTAQGIELNPVGVGESIELLPEIRTALGWSCLVMTTIPP